MEDIYGDRSTTTFDAFETLPTYPAKKARSITVFEINVSQSVRQPVSQSYTFRRGWWREWCGWMGCCWIA
jgi:hypothetical protein